MSRGNGCCVSRKRPEGGEKGPPGFWRRACAYRSLGQELQKAQEAYRAAAEKAERLEAVYRREKSGVSLGMSRQGFWQKDWRREESARSAAPSTILHLPESRKEHLRKPSFGNPRQRSERPEEQTREASAEAAKKKGGVQEKTAYLRERLAGLLKYGQAASEEPSKAERTFQPEELPGARELFLGGTWEQELDAAMRGWRKGFPGWRGRSGRKRRESAEKKSWGGKSPGRGERQKDPGGTFQASRNGWQQPLRARKELEAQAQGLRGRLPSARSREAARKAEQLEQQKKALEEAL